MAKHKRISIGALICLLAAGAAFATGAALLLAPTSGAELRKKLGGMWKSVEKSASKELHEIESTLESTLHPAVKKTTPAEVDGHRPAPKS